MKETLDQKLSNEGIKGYNLGAESQKLKCPKCQPPHKMSDNPLILLFGNVIIVNGLVFGHKTMVYTDHINRKLNILDLSQLKETLSIMILMVISRSVGYLSKL